MSIPAPIKAVVANSNESSGMPDGWAQSRLGEVAHARLGKTPRRKDYRDDGIYRIIKFRDVTENGMDFSVAQSGYVVDEPDAIKGLRFLLLHDVLLTASAHSGDQIGKKCAFVDRLPQVTGHVYFVGELLGITADTRVMCSKWPYLWFLSEDGIKVVQDAVFGVHLTAGRAQNIPIPIAPLAEQERIVTTVEALLPRVNAARERLANVSTILKCFRQSVLVAACSGQLTLDWREQRTTDLDGADLLSDILAKRRELFETYNSGRYKKAGLPTNEEDYEYPDEWAVASIDQLTCLVTSGSRGWAKYYSEHGPLFVRAKNINTDELRLDDIAHVQPPESSEGRRTRVQQNDLLITITGANVTKSALVDVKLGEAYVSQHVALVRSVHTDMAPYLFLWTISPAHGRAKLTKDAYGAGKPGLNLDNIKEVPVALPSLSEQDEIVRRVAALFALADRIEQRTKAALQQVEQTTQSILARAFRGKLVETEAECACREDRKYESATQSVERIQVERANFVSEKPRRKTRQRKSAQ